ncbi:MULTISPECIES: SDR family NAD(P)-dependent oxidoreductase [unclassified Nocardioides]|uniref:SDR family NAD(P)-dependent oxidoreductase n=1 Tax=unclassified Nocardioides TaxID=2615069 RepID=UPI00070325E2|nr:MULTISPECIES: SDR family NAD(P)-dependent oxidoreductase [unclassified Nocardioides]KRC53802.1 3-hydroxy-2-methylbutyryl-CoA dehydrogenase [Nocardioides sp. Root79]KRC71137.1 3-hydroxy-2-methylbutyryl-CoA dehydrogenase [Nocardioides sp. Root240]
MKIENTSVLVTGGASGLGLATARILAKSGATVTILDLPTSDGQAVADQLGGHFVGGDVRDEHSVNEALDAAEKAGTIRAVVHCAGSGHTLRILDKQGNPAPLEHYTKVININLVGSFNVLRLAAARLARTESVDGERGVIIMTASVAAFEGQIGQIPYASSKAGVVGMTLVAARDLAGKEIRVCTIAPGIFETPLLGRLSQEVRDSLGASVPHPKRLGTPDEYASLAAHIIDNPMLNGETIRLDGAIRMAPR